MVVLMHQVQLEMQNEELRRLQFLLEESRDRYHDLYDFAPVGYLILTREGLITEINLTAARLLGIDRSQLLNRRFVSFVTAQDGDKWCLFFAGIMKSNTQQNTELNLRGTDNTKVVAQLDCIPINRMLRVTLTDITKSKQTEETLCQAEKLAIINAESLSVLRVQENALNRLQEITSQIPGMVFQLDQRVDGTFSMPYASSGIFKLYRLSPEQISKDISTLWSIIHPDDYNRLMSDIQNSAQNLSSFSCEYRVQFDDGTVRWLLSKASARRNVDGSTLWYGYTSDITEQKSIKDELTASEFY